MERIHQGHQTLMFVSNEQLIPDGGKPLFGRGNQALKRVKRLARSPNICVVQRVEERLSEARGSASCVDCVTSSEGSVSSEVTWV